MRTEQEYLEITTRLVEKEDYQGIVDLLTDEVLEQLKSASLYFYRGNALGKLNEYFKAINDYTNAVKYDSNLTVAYNNRGIIWSNLKDYDKAIFDYTIAINKDYSDAYLNRGLAWGKKGESDKAIDDYTKAIMLNKYDPEAYFNRGNSWADKGEYDKAIQDYTTSINIKKDYIYALLNRGIAWGKKGEHDKAKNDFSTVIDIENDSVMAYIGRGVELAKESYYDKAIIDFTKAIEFDNHNTQAFFNRGISLLEIRNIDKAIEDFTKVISIDGSYTPAYIKRAIAWSIIDNYDNSYEDFYTVFKIEENNPNSTSEISINFMLFQIIYSLRDSVDKTDLKLIWIQYIRNIFPSIFNIRTKALNKENIWQNTESKYVAHYTNLKTADLLLIKEGSKLRYSNAIFMNDPQEGEILIDCIDSIERKNRDFTHNNSDTGKIKSAFNNVMEQEQTNFYLGSFLPVTKDHEDELIMWRTYGRDENQKEACGCSLVISVDFFDSADLGYIAANKNETRPMPQPIYRVLYYDQRKEKFSDSDEIENEIKELKDGLIGLLEMKKPEQSDYAKTYNYAIDKVLYHSLSELRYFFKSADFAYENELRVIQYATNKDVVKIDEQSNSLPRKVFIESSKPLLPHLKEIVLGPMVPHPERWMYLQKIMTDKGHDFKLRHSNCRFQ